MLCHGYERTIAHAVGQRGGLFRVANSPCAFHDGGKAVVCRAWQRRVYIRESNVGKALTM